MYKSHGEIFVTIKHNGRSLKKVFLFLLLKFILLYLFSWLTLLTIENY